MPREIVSAVSGDTYSSHLLTAAAQVARPDIGLAVYIDPWYVLRVGAKSVCVDKAT